MSRPEPVAVAGPARIAAVATAVPPHRLEQADAAAFARGLFGGRFRDIERLLPVFSRGLVETRQMCMPLQWYGQEHDFREKNDLYVKSACELGVSALRRCLDSGGLSPRDVDHLFFVSTTGLATPSVDARLINLLDMKPHVKRTPIWGLGCAGGAAGLARAAEYARAFPGQNVALVAVELCGLTFLKDDLSKNNLVAASLFGDGAAAVLIQSGGAPGPAVVDSMSTLWKDSLDVMGWDFASEGMRVIFSKDIPALVTSRFKQNVEVFLSANGLRLSDVRRFILHPGGGRVLAAYREALSLEDGALTHSKEVLRRFGNVSSATVLFVLERALSEGEPGDYGLIAALGPGFSAELALIRW